MPDHGDELPEYLLNLPPLSDDQLWESIQYEFNGLAETLNYRAQTLEEAVGKVKTVGQQRVFVNRSLDWNEVPYSASFDPTLLDKWRNEARELVHPLADAISRRELTPLVVLQLLRFMERAAALRALEDANDPDVSGKRRTESRRQEEHLIWFSHALKHLGWPKVGRKEAEWVIFKHVKAMAEGKAALPFTEKWYARFLTTRGDADLKKTFKSKGGLSDAEVERLASVDFDDLPPLPKRPE